jgi:IS30 family transposase
MRRLSVAEKELIAKRSAAGVPSRRIARDIGRLNRTVHDHVDRLRRRPPPTRQRSERQLCLAEREEVSWGLAEGRSLRVIAAGSGRDPSTVCREVARNGGQRRYRAARADTRAEAEGRRPRVAKLAVAGPLRVVVEDRLGLRWSPQQICGWLRAQYAGQVEMQVGHETIYLSLFVQSRGALRKELTRQLRRGHATRRPRSYSTYNGQGRLRDVINISERPAEVEDRVQPGHWEGDMIMGTANKSAIVTLVERTSRKVVLVHLNRERTAAAVSNALISVFGALRRRCGGH